MKEIPSPKNAIPKRLLLTATLLLAGSSTSCGLVYMNKPGELPEPPSGFTRDTDEYRWRIAAKEDGLFKSNEVVLFTNETPEIKEGFMIATNVYCPLGNREFPDFQNNHRDEAGCTEEFMKTWIREGNVTVSDNQGVR